MGEVIFLDKDKEGKEFRLASSKKKPARLYVTKTQASMIIGLSESYINVLMRDRDLSYVKLDKRVMFNVTDLIGFMESRKIPAKK